jgi:predicted GIY-YIG superfamily endonuclease
MIGYNSNKYAYVLKLVKGKYYCGVTGNISRRMKSHFSGEGSKWTNKYPPVAIEECFSVAQGQSLNIVEQEKTKEYISIYGWENVRGAGWTIVDLDKKWKSDRMENVLKNDLKEYRLLNPVYFIRPVRNYKYDLSYRPRIECEESHIFEEYSKYIRSMEEFKGYRPINENWIDWTLEMNGFTFIKEESQFVD